MPRIAKVLISAVLCLWVDCAVGAAWSAEPQGVWMRDDGSARVEVAPCGDKLCATYLWVRNASENEQVGDRLVLTLQPTSSNTLAGTAYDRKRDRTYSFTVTQGNGSMTTRGCLVGSLLCKQTGWIPAGQAAR